MARSVSHTSRPPRDAEQDGVHYHFCTKHQIEELERAGRLIEKDMIHGNLYATSVDAVLKVVGSALLLMVRQAYLRSFDCAEPGCVQSNLATPTDCSSFCFVELQVHHNRMICATDMTVRFQKPHCTMLKTLLTSRRACSKNLGYM